jgi:formylglycine-generating enzyme required for sulfatase activity
VEEEKQSWLEAEARRKEEAAKLAESRRKAAEEAERRWQEAERARARADQEAQRLRRPMESAPWPGQGKAPAEAERTPAQRIPTHQPRKPWEDSLGMKFASVPVRETELWFCLWPTRVKDYATFVGATNRSWREPCFEQGPTHPAVNVSWEDAQAFCQWLTKKERAEGRLAGHHNYRLPTDEEWSWAVGLDDEEPGLTPGRLSRRIQGVYPWGPQWPPPKGAGNYASNLRVDDYEYTSPVGSFAPNQLGLFDLGGNVWEWCEDKCEFFRVLRGASWFDSSSSSLLASSRSSSIAISSFEFMGFRAVLTGLIPTESIETQENR